MQKQTPPTKEEPKAQLKRARDLFNGVMNDFHDHLLNTPPLPHLPSGGYADWQRFRFDTLAVEETQPRGEKFALILSSSDPEATRLGLRKYGASWAAHLHNWFGSDVEVEVRNTPTKEQGQVAR